MKCCGLVHEFRIVGIGHAARQRALSRTALRECPSPGRAGRLRGRTNTIADTQCRTGSGAPRVAANAWVSDIAHSLVLSVLTALGSTRAMGAMVDAGVVRRLSPNGKVGRVQGDLDCA